MVYYVGIQPRVKVDYDFTVRVRDVHISVDTPSRSSDRAIERLRTRPTPPHILVLTA